MLSYKHHLLCASLLIFVTSPVFSVPHSFPSTNTLVPQLLDHKQKGIGGGWSGGSSSGPSNFQALGMMGLREDLDVVLFGIPRFGQNRNLIIGTEILYTPWIRNNWSLGGYFGASTTLWGIQTFGDHQISVKHRLTSFKSGASVRRKWFYFSLGYLHLYNQREYFLTGQPSDSLVSGLRTKFGHHHVGTIHYALGLVFGEDLKIKFELGLMQDRVYNVMNEPNPSISAVPATLGLSVLYTPAPKDRKPVINNKHSRPRLSQPKGELFNTSQFQRGLQYAALASLAGIITGVTYAKLSDQPEDQFFPPELTYGLVGAILPIPIGSFYGVYSHENKKNKPIWWTLTGTVAGAGVGILLAPITFGASLYFGTVLGSAMGYQWGIK